METHDNLLYGSFNARYLSYVEVAESFIPSVQFEDLIKSESTLLMGPRGCGKTTLLKMLTIDGIKHTTHPVVKEIVERINFIGIYIPTDIQWKNQFKYVSKHINDTSDQNFIFKAMVHLNVLVSLIRTFQRHLSHSIFDSNEVVRRENEICRNICKFWELDIDDTSKNFGTIELLLLGALSQLNGEVNISVSKRLKTIEYETLPRILFKDFVDLTRIAVRIYESSMGLDSEQKWALCFDELELLPKKQQMFIVSLLRSTDQKLIYKITSTPVLGITDEVLATPKNDFEPVKLWVYDSTGQSSWRAFCQEFTS
ncbi:MAG: hypothetical protein JJ975_09805, partial [Bacteroidia bacterium]|nr:hypothetical protein [Bacteroidia bacterium]